MRSRFLLVTGVLAMLIFLGITAPAGLFVRLIPADSGMGISGAAGSFWRGQLAGVSFRDRPLGTVRYETAALALLGGRLAADLVLANGPVEGEGRVSISGDRVALSGADLSLELARVGLPFAGRLEATDVAGEWQAARCALLEGSLWTDALARSLPELDWAGPPLTGPLACNPAGGVTATLRSQSAEGTVVLTIDVAADGRYVGQVMITPTSPRLRTALALTDLEDRDGSYIRPLEGRLAP